MPSSAQTIGSSRKSAYSSVWNTSAENAAATTIRPRSRAPGSSSRRRRSRPPNSSRNAATSTNRYAASPITPCSAATVIGIVCDAEAACASPFFSRARKRSANEPEP